MTDEAKARLGLLDRLAESESERDVLRKQVAELAENLRIALLVEGAFERMTLAQARIAELEERIDEVERSEAAGERILIDAVRKLAPARRDARRSALLEAAESFEKGLGDNWWVTSRLRDMAEEAPE